MNPQRLLRALLGGVALCALAFACQPPGVGDPCSPEVHPLCTGSGDNMECQPWAYGEVSVETRSLQCKTRTCMVYHFFPAGREQGEPDWRVCPGKAVDATNRQDCGLKDGTSCTPCTPNCGEDGYAGCDPTCCNWPDDDDAAAPCRETRENITETFVKHFCKLRRDDTGHWEIAPPSLAEEDLGWYCDFDMTLVNASQPFCTLKCGGAGRTFACPDGYLCREVVTQGPEGMRGSYCIPSRLVDCDRTLQGEQDCCENTFNLPSS